MTLGKTERSAVEPSAYAVPADHGKSMEDLFERERAAERKVHALLKSQAEPALNILSALEEYRQLSQQATFADFEHGSARRSAHLWAAHMETRKLLHRALAGVRKKDEVVTTRQITKLYLQFVKDSQRFYRAYIFNLNAAFGGIHELEAAAHKVRTDAVDESPPPSITPELRARALEQCHQALIYLGDISRYRASEKLDKNPDFGPAIGYYGLACALFPSSGMGQHQQAVVALEQRQHLRAIYHLYRAIVVEEPHPLARNNLRLEFDKTNAAWDRGELIPKGSPNDVDGPRRALIGWYVRLQSMCVKGTPFRGYEELEREVLGRLAAEIKQRPLDTTLTRMVLVNIAAQYCAAENFKAEPTEQHEHAFFHLFRFNIRTLTTLLRVFHEDLSTIQYTNPVDEDVDLTTRLSTVTCRLMPSLRLYTSWLLPSIPLLHGLSSDNFLKDAILEFWPTFARTVDLVAAVFPIWDLEDVSPVTYLLEEDTDTLGFKPLMHANTPRISADSATGATKPRFSDRGVVRVKKEEEMLSRIFDFLNIGLSLANDDETAPIKLCGTRVLMQDADEPEVLPMPSLRRPEAAIVPNGTQNAKKASSTPTKPLSYAAAAAKPQPQNKRPPKAPAQAQPPSRQAELSRMVDDLLDDDDNKITQPSSSMMSMDVPRSLPTTQAIPNRTRGSYPSPRGGRTGSPAAPSYAHQAAWRQVPTRAGQSSTSPGPSTVRTSHSAHGIRAQSVSSFWDQLSARQTATPGQSPSNLAPSTLTTPRQTAPRGHSRGNSATSNRSSGPPSGFNTTGEVDSWSSLESATRRSLHRPSATPAASPLPSTFTGFDSSVPSPLLFGAGGSLWSTNHPRAGVSNTTPPNGQSG